ncbi:aspartyl protease family-like protein isoform X2 [Cinnamomum micranthum f. kanehirae]|uniref:Aspartyl protease family-like protein isoform X2 n=1 Tax=Cinnamomum micranthum f. kanehirae TaxID=337451 RepID=A0A3S3RB67_9MAGN|nr:aspartyl protease family-like protein isoform X2 [Cinnamomum micranthum f. kanehirae]
MACSGLTLTAHVEFGRAVSRALTTVFRIQSSAAWMFGCPLTTVDGKENRSFYSIKVGSLAPSTTCYSPKGFNNFGLRVVHRHGPCSPFGGGRASHHQILGQDQARVNLIHSRISKSTQKLQRQSASLPANLGIPFSTSNYIVTVGFGTPKKDMTVAFDTGSDLTWIQCKPCAFKCYNQTEPIFDSSQSTSFVKISCNSAECTRLSSATGNPSSCDSAACKYSIEYGDGSTSAGIFGQETLTLTSTDVIRNFRFGCGQNNDGLFGETAGLLGLGRDSVSIVSQTARKYSQVFSYCLPSSSSSEGYLNFGTKAIRPRVNFTSLVSNPNAPSFYFLEMIGISVGGIDIGIPPSTFSSPGTIIDSGTVITRLQPDAYSALKSAFQKGMSNYTMASAYELFDTCYNFSGVDTVSVPTIKLRFKGGVDVDVGIYGTFYVVSQSQFCLAFAGNKNLGSIGIIGNRQQRTVNVVYDVAHGRIGFGAGGCS